MTMDSEENTNNNTDAQAQPEAQPQQPEAQPQQPEPQNVPPEAAPVALAEAPAEVPQEEATPPLESQPNVPASQVKRDAPDRSKLRWYVVHTYSGFEFKARQALEERVRQLQFQDYFGEVRVPQETVVELVRGQKKTSSRKFFPGYILVQMILNQDTWHVVKETPKVTGFVGDATDPSPLSEEEVQRVLTQAEEGAASPRAKASFEQGDVVKVIDGPFTDFNGTVEEVKPDKGKVKVLISIFGRATPVELDFIQVEKS
jgi:transcription termination/antitermination protein NusG